MARRKYEGPRHYQGVRYEALDRWGKAAYERTLRESHRIRVRIDVYDRDEEFVETLDAQVVEGQVDYDITADIRSSMSLTLADRDTKLAWSPMGKVYADNFLSAVYGVYVPADENVDGSTWTTGAWVEVGVFFGPITKYDRNGHEVQLEAQGKESLLLPPAKQSIGDPDPPANRYMRTVLVRLLEPFGEERIALGDLRGKKVPGNYSIDPAKIRDNGVWWYMRSLARSRNFGLYYDGDGYLRARRLNPGGEPSWHFQDLLTEPAVAYDILDVRNRVEVWDQTTKGQPDPLVRLDLLPASHPLSKESLARNGKDRILVERIEENETKMTIADGVALADGVLKQHSQGVMSVQFEHLPIPQLRLGTKVAAHVEAGQLAEGTTVPFTLHSYTLPLTADDSMAVGYTRPIKLSKRFRYKVTKI